MSISLSTISLPPFVKALVDILRLEGGPGALPVSNRLAGYSLAAFGLGEAGLQGIDHEWAPAIAYGLISVALLVAVTALVLFVVGARERLAQTLTALGATGAIVAVSTIVLHLFVALAFPPPLPTGKLVGFVLFPLVIWNVTLFAWLYRHASLRFIPALAVAGCYVGVTTFIIAPLIVRIAERI